MIPITLIEDENNINEEMRKQQLASMIVTAGYVFELGKKKNFWISPQFLFKYMPSGDYELPIEMDANIVFTLYQIVGLGVTYRTGIADPYDNRESVDAMAVFYLPKDITIGYAYDQTISKVKAYNNGTHEILLGYDVNWKKKGIRTPRYF
jgi:type IX secretion system PorP/SprF family membrane protein